MDVLIVDTIALLAKLPLPPASPTAVTVRGYYNPADGGGGDFVWVESTPPLLPDDGINIRPDLTPTYTGNGRWVRQAKNDGEINVKWFGARGTGADDTDEFQKALNYQLLNGGEIIVPTGNYTITSTLEYFTSNRSHGLRIKGAGRGKSNIVCSISNRTSLLKIRCSLPSQFMWGGHIKGLSIVASGAQPYWSQQAAIDIGNSVEMLIEDCQIQGIAGHGIWACGESVSVNNNDGSGTDFPNDKPWVTADRFRPAGRPVHLQARVSPNSITQVTGQTSAGADTVSNVDTSGITVGAFVSGGGFPQDTIVVAVVTAGSTGLLRLSNKALTSGSVNLSINSGGTVTGFRLYRIGSGYRDGAVIDVRGCGFGFKGKAKTSFTLYGTTNRTTDPTDPSNFQVTGVFLSGTGNTVSGSNLITVSTGTTGIAKGCSIVGTGIPAGATVTKVIDYDTLQLSVAAIATSPTVGVPLGIGKTAGSTIGKVQVGYFVRGDGVPDGTTVTAIPTNSRNELTLSAAATSSLSDTSLTFYAPDSGFISLTGDTVALNPAVCNINTTDLQPGYLVSGPGITPGTTVLDVTSGTAITLSQASTATTTGAQLNFITPDGGVVDYQIDASGSNYYEENDHLYDNPDPYTVSQMRVVRTEISYCHGVGLVFPHFASCQLSIENCSISRNMEGGVVFGGNSFVMRSTSLGANGMHVGNGGPGYYPGVWLRRGDSSAEMIRLSENEFDSNTYCHVLLDGVDGAEISRNRCNSWVTAWPYNTDWKAQIPPEQIKFDPGNAASGNTGIVVRNNRHRSQPVDGSVPQTNVTALAHNAVVAGASNSPLASQTFIVGARVKILVGSTAISFDGTAEDGTPAKETTVTAITPTITTLTGNVTAGSVTITNLTDTATSPTPILPKAPISGAGIPAGTRVLSVSGNTLTMTLAATAGGTQVPLTVAGTMTLALAPSVDVTSGVIRVIINDEGVTGVDLGGTSLVTATEIADPVNGITGDHGHVAANWRNGLGTGVRYYQNGAQIFGNPGTGGASGRINYDADVLLPGGGETAIPWTIAGDAERRLVPTTPGTASRYLPMTSGIFEVTGCLTLAATPIITAGDVFEVRLVQEFDTLDLTGASIPAIPLQLEKIAFKASETGTTLTMPFAFSVPLTVLNTYIGQNRPAQQPNSGMAGLVWWNPETKRQWRWSGTLWQLVAKTTKDVVDAFDPNTRLSIRVFNGRSGDVKLLGGAKLDGRQNFVTFKQVG